MRAAVLPRRSVSRGRHRAPSMAPARRAGALGASARATMAVLALLAGLSLVAWRQARALEALAALERVRQEKALAGAEWAELQRHIQVLESRGRVVPAAREGLGMHTPEAREIVILAGVQP